jgi:hypothetical protein
MLNIALRAEPDVKKVMKVPNNDSKDDEEAYVLTSEDNSTLSTRCR